MAAVKSALIATHTGALFDVANPDPSLISIVDIAHALAHTSRFSGHTDVLYTVAEHCVRMSMHPEVRDTPFALEALLHDAGEAYLNDIPSPIKAMLPDYQALEAKVDAAVRERFGLPLVESPQIKALDQIFVDTEKRDCFQNFPKPHPLAGDDMVIKPWLPGKFSKAKFLERFRELAAA